MAGIKPGEIHKLLKPLGVSLKGDTERNERRSSSV